MKIGDVVRMKGDGPMMTVEAIKEDEVHVVWFDGNHSAWHGPYRDRFPAATLHVSSEEKGA